METEDVINQLFMWGCDTDAALERVLDDESVYLTLINDYCNDEDIDTLGEYIIDKNVEEGFSLSHTMKGVYGNLGLTPIYDVLCEIVELLRNGMKPGVEDKMDELRELKKELDNILGNE